MIIHLCQPQDDPSMSGWTGWRDRTTYRWSASKKLIFDVNHDRSSLKFVLGIHVVSWLALNQV